MENRINFNDFERINPTPIYTPKRSLLFQIYPIAVKTDNVESLTGYLSRISYEHCVKSGQLLKSCLIKSNEGFNKNTKIPLARDLNGFNRSAESVVKILQEATLIDEIKFTNMLSLKHVISNVRLLQESKYWCPACLDEDVKKNRPVYERLIWNLEAVEVCSIHQSKLFKRCPYCKEINRRSFSKLYGFCSLCRKWLGDSLNTNSLYRGKKEFSSKALWVEREIRSVFKCFPTAESLFNKEDLLDALFYLVMSQTNGNISRFCRKVDLTDYDFISLFSGKSLISLRKLIAICYPFKISPVSLLKGEVPEILLNKDFENRNKEDLNERYSLMFLDANSYKTKQISKERVERAKSLMKDLLNKEPISPSKVSQIVNIKTEILKRLLPVLSWQLTLRYRRRNALPNNQLNDEKDSYL